VGDYQDNKKQGNGTFVYPDGSKYEGISYNVVILQYMVLQDHGRVINVMVRDYTLMLTVTAMMEIGVITSVMVRVLMCLLIQEQRCVLARG